MAPTPTPTPTPSPSLASLFIPTMPGAMDLNGIKTETTSDDSPLQKLLLPLDTKTLVSPSSALDSSSSSTITKLEIQPPQEPPAITTTKIAAAVFLGLFAALLLVALPLALYNYFRARRERVSARGEGRLRLGI